MWSLVDSAASSPIEVNLRPYAVGIVTVPSSYVHLVGLPILEVLDDFSKQEEGFVSLTGNSHELSLVSSSPDVVGRFRLFSQLVHVDLGWRVFQVEMLPEELAVPGGAGGSGVKVQQISRVLARVGVSIYYTCSDLADYFLCRSSEYGIVCSALARQGWLGSTSSDVDAPVEPIPELDLDISHLPRIADDVSDSGLSRFEDADPLSVDVVVHPRFLECGSGAVSPTDLADVTSGSFESASEDISTASPTASQTLFSRPPPQQSPFKFRIGFKSSFGLVGTSLSSAATKSFLQRWFLGDAADHPFFSVVGDTMADEVAADGQRHALQVAMYAAAETIERFVPGSVDRDDFDDAEAACRGLFQMDHARRSSAPAYSLCSTVKPPPVPTMVPAARPPIVHRHSLPLTDLTFVDQWLQGLEPSIAASSSTVHDTPLEQHDTLAPAGGVAKSSSDGLGVTRVWGSIEIHLYNSDGLHRPGIIHAYTDRLTQSGIDILCFSTGNSVNILVPQPKLLLARRILQVGH